MTESAGLHQVSLPEHKAVRRVDKGRVFPGGIVADSPRDRPVTGRERTAAADSVFAPVVPGPITASNGGGAIATRVPIQLIFWGSAWNVPATTPSAATIIAQIQTVLAGPWFSGLRQYGVRRCPFGSSMVVTSPAPPTTYNDDDISTLAWSLIDEGMFPEPDEPGGRNIYVVFMPPGTTYGPGGIRGKHIVASDFDFPADIDKAWVAFICTNTLDQITSTFCHEIAETCTDPESDAWTVTGNQEIGDVCNFVDQVQNGITLESYWSATDNACLLPTAYSLRRGLQWSGKRLNGRGLRSIQDPIPSLNKFVVEL